MIKMVNLTQTGEVKTTVFLNGQRMPWASSCDTVGGSVETYLLPNGIIPYGDTDTSAYPLVDVSGNPVR